MNEKSPNQALPADQVKPAVTQDRVSVSWQQRYLKWPYILALFCVLSFTALTAGIMVFDRISAFQVPALSKPYELRKGETADTAALELTRGHIPAFAVKLWMDLHPEFNKVQKGFYQVDGIKRLAEIMHDMAEGNAVQIKPPSVTLVEGMSLAGFLKRLQGIKVIKYQEDTLKDASAIIKDTLKHEELLQAVGGVHDSLEGLLLPATYPYFEQESALKVVERALLEMAEFMQVQWPKRDPDIAIEDPYSALILASIVERETSLVEEAPKIAMVFYNRMKKGMRLQTDPAVMYGVHPEFRGPLSKKHLRQDTPYNTYRREGLPPTPIAMPGKQSILAVLHPAAGKDLYFVAKTVDPRDGHVFSESLSQHNNAVGSYRKQVRAYYDQKNKADSETKPKSQPEAAQPVSDQKAAAAESPAAAKTADTAPAAGAAAPAPDGAAKNKE